MSFEASSQARLAIVADDGEHTYDELAAAARRVAGALLGGAQDLEGARVAYFVPPSFAHAAVQRGIWYAGGVAVPLAVSHPPVELDYVIRDSGASIVIGSEGIAEVLAPLAEAAGARFILTSDALAGPEAESAASVAEDARALIVYTSGTTGRPKGVVSTHSNMSAQVSALIEAWGWVPEDRLLLTLPLHHVHGIINGLISALTAGATAEILPSFHADPVWERLASGEITVFTAVPTIYSRLISSWDAATPEVQRARSEGARRVRLMMSGSAALPVQTLDRWREITGHTLLERYGMTELGMALSNPLEGERRPGFVGAPLPEVEVRLVDEAGLPVGEGTPGELEVRGPGVTREYWQRPKETDESFRDGWFRTGDMALLDNGSYRLLGRTSVDIIKTGGFKVSALEIEELLRTHSAIADCAIVGVDDVEWGERVSAAVELSPGATLTLDELQAWAKPQLAPYKVPRALRLVEALPRNAMGKVVKKEVSKLFEAE